jgi:hypothetical protein
MTKRSALSLILGLDKEPEFSVLPFLFGDESSTAGPPKKTQADTLREEHYKAVGRIVVEFSAVEFFMSFYVSILLDKELVTGKLIALGLNFRELQRLLKRLFFHREKDADIQSQLNSLLKTLDDLYGNERNRVVHDFWHYNYFGNKVVRLQEAYDGKKRQMRSNKRTFDFKSLERIGDDILSASVALNTFMMDWLQRAELMPKKQKRTLAQILKEIKGE